MIRYLISGLAVFSLGLASTSTAQGLFSGKIGNFSYFREIDKITDEDTSFIVAEANEGNGELTWRCLDNSLYIYVVPEESTFSEESYSVAFRFDKEDSGTLDGWLPSSDKEALFVASEYIDWFTIESSTRNQIIIRTMGDNGKPVTSTYKLNGLKDSLKKLSCTDLS